MFVTRPFPYVHPALALSPCVPVPPASEGKGFTMLLELRDQFSPKLMLFCERRLPPPLPPPPPPPPNGPNSFCRPLNRYCCPVLGLKIWTGLPSLYVAAEKLPPRSSIVGTVENASYGVLPRDPFHPPKKNHLLPPLRILGMFSGPPMLTPKRAWL